jgi:hypothetical protein
LFLLLHNLPFNKESFSKKRKVVVVVGAVNHGNCELLAIHAQPDMDSRFDDPVWCISLGSEFHRARNPGESLVLVSPWKDGHDLHEVNAKAGFIQSIVFFAPSRQP